MSYPEKVLTNVKEHYEKTGYPQNIFNDDYWLFSDGINPARVDKSAHQLIDYFDCLFNTCFQHRRFTICDIGAGAGNMVQQFRDSGYQIEGCEFSESGRKIAKDHFNIKLKTCDLRKRLPYRNNEFDFSYCVGVLSMIPLVDMENALKEIFRITKYGVLINVGTNIANNKNDRMGNPHHLTSVTTVSMWQMIVRKLGYYDWTSILPPQKRKFGIGVAGEFCGLFSKRMF